MRPVKPGETTRSCRNDSAWSWSRRLRRRLVDAAHRRFGPEAPWVRRHAAHCPHCQRRLASLARVDLTLSIIKSQPHRLDLLTRANTAAIRMLSCQLRQSEAAERLKEAKPEPTCVDPYAGHQNAILNVAACLAILLLTKAGIFASLDKARTRGEATMKQYYANRAGEDLAGEVFKS